MNIIRKAISTFAGISLAVLLFAALAPKATRGVAAALVEVVNPPSNPVITSDVHLLPRIPVELDLCLAFGFFSCSGLSPQFTAPASVTSANGLTITNPLLVIDNESSTCTQVGDNAFGVQFLKNPGTNSEAFLFPLSSTGSLSNTFFLTSNQQTHIYFQPGDIIEVEPSGTAATNVICFGHLIGYYTAQQ